MEFVQDLLPYDAVTCVDARKGARIAYIDTNLEIRIIGCPSDRFIPGFTSPAVSVEMMAFLKRRLAEEAPWAAEMRLLKRQDGTFFLCAIEE